METALKLISGSFSAMQVNVARFLLGGLALAPFALRDYRRLGRKFTGKDLVRTAGIAFLGMVVSMTFYQLSVMAAPANMVAVLCCGNTAFVLLFTPLCLHVPAKRSEMTAVGLALVGMALIIAPFAPQLSAKTIFISTMAPASFGLYTIYSTQICHRFSGVFATCVIFLLGSAEILLLVWIAGMEPLAGFLRSHGMAFLADVHLLEGFTPWTLAGLLYVSVGVTGIGFACYFMTAQLASPFTAALCFLFKPVLAPVIAYLVLGERVPFAMLCGIVLILSGPLSLLIPGFLEARRARQALRKGGGS